MLPVRQMPPGNSNVAPVHNVKESIAVDWTQVILLMNGDFCRCVVGTKTIQPFMLVNIGLLNLHTKLSHYRPGQALGVPGG